MHFIAKQILAQQQYGLTSCKNLCLCPHALCALCLQLQDPRALCYVNASRINGPGGPLAGPDTRVRQR